MYEVTADALAYANTQSKRLRELILRPETLVMPGAYDGLTARLFEAMGFKLGTSGKPFTMGEREVSSVRMDLKNDEIDPS